MTLANSYLITTKNLESFFNAVLSAQAPERFTQKFLENLEFKSTNDRLFIRLLKDLKFLHISPFFLTLSFHLKLIFQFTNKTQHLQIQKSILH